MHHRRTEETASMKTAEMNVRGNVRLITLIAAVMVLFVIFVMNPQDLHQLTTYSVLESSNEIRLSEYADPPGYLVYSPSCKIADNQPWDNSIRRYFKSSSLLRCSKRPLLTSILTMTNGSYLLRIEKECNSLPCENLLLTLGKGAVSAYKERNADDVSCCYSEITRVSETPKKYDMEADNKFRYSQCKNFQNETVLPRETEFIRVKCVLKRKNKSIKEVYRDAHAVVPILSSALKKMKEYDMIRTLPSVISRESADEFNLFNRLNVLILGIDSISRLNLRRMMPKTFKYLRQNEWLEMNGYTKIADNTFPNLMAILTGRNVSDIYNFCYKNRSKSLDDCPYIWKQFGDVGYITAYAEDTPNISTFNYLRTGFVEKPTDYYLRPFMLAVHSSLIKTKVYGLPVCVGPVAPVDHILRYARRFLNTFNNFSHFSLFWMNSLSHNNPSMAQNMDVRTLNFLQDLTDIGTYNNTLVIFLSDHGTRFGDFRHAFLGYYEERLPFLFIWLPAWFRKKYPLLYANILTNQKRLTCPFDVHLTLVSILKGNYALDEELDEDEKLPACPKCTSLFNRVPKNRGCEDAAIAEAWCMCDEFVQIKAHTPLITKLGKFVKNIVVNKTKQLEIEEKINNTVCATWKFNKVIRAHQIIPVKWNLSTYNYDKINSKNWFKKGTFMVLVELNPGKTRFEAVVEVTKSLSGNIEVFNVKSAPSRLDGYSKFSQCVKSPNLKYYCYCNNL